MARRAHHERQGVSRATGKKADMAQAQKRQAEPAWLIADQDRDGQAWFSVRLFLGECGPIYFGPFQDTRQAEAPPP